MPGYTIWTFHGEHTSFPSSQSSSIPQTSSTHDDIRGLVQDAFGVASMHLENEELRDSTLQRDISQTSGENNIEGDVNETSDEEANSQQCDPGVEDPRYKFLLKECDKELFVGCKYSNLSFTLRLYHIQCIGGISNKAFGMLLELLRDAFPQLTSLPTSANEVKKLTQDLGLGYQKIHACPNDCMLYWQEREGQQACHICNASRYISADESGKSSTSHKSMRPAKVLRYFPLIPRLKRLYMCEKTAGEMRWHEIGLTKDGKLRHPADGLAWKAFNSRYPEFFLDPRNVRLGLASDGFNPFRAMGTTYSTWPVLLIPYNLPPWICMKQQSFILSAIIPGEKGPGNDIDVYMRPLI